jgi:hypothetical protein
MQPLIGGTGGMRNATAGPCNPMGLSSRVIGNGQNFFLEHLIADTGTFPQKCDLLSVGPDCPRQDDIAVNRIGLAVLDLAGTLGRVQKVALFNKFPAVIFDFLPVFHPNALMLKGGVTLE